MRFFRQRLPPFERAVSHAPTRQGHSPSPLGSGTVPRIICPDCHHLKGKRPRHSSPLDRALRAEDAQLGHRVAIQSPPLQWHSNSLSLAFKQDLNAVNGLGVAIQTVTGIQPGGSAQGSLGLVQEGIGRARPVQGFRATMSGALIRAPWRLRKDGTHESRRSLAAPRCASWARHGKY